MPSTPISPKVTAAALGAAVSTVVVWAVETLGTLDIPTGVEGAVVTIATFALGYLVSDPMRGRHRAEPDK